MPYRVGLIVPSSNTTMETEIPAMLRRHDAAGEFTFHSSRMRMQQVTPEQLAAMDDQATRCASELADARCDVVAYACLVAIMSRGRGYHEQAEATLSAALAEYGGPAPVMSSAGALLRALHLMRARRVAIITPYLKPLTATVADYIASGGARVCQSVSLEVADNLAVGRLDPNDLIGVAGELELDGCDALVLSACVQMPSLPVVDAVEQKVGLPVVTAATATAHAILSALDLPPVVPEAGHLLSGRPLAMEV